MIYWLCCALLLFVGCRFCKFLLADGLIHRGTAYAYTATDFTLMRICKCMCAYMIYEYAFFGASFIESELVLCLVHFE